MAYSTSNPPALVSQTVGGTHRRWAYKSADAIADVNTAGYFSNGYKLGMRVGDTVEIIDTTNTLVHTAFVNAASSSSVDLTDGLAITSTDTD